MRKLIVCFYIILSIELFVPSYGQSNDQFKKEKRYWDIAKKAKKAIKVTKNARYIIDEIMEMRRRLHDIKSDAFSKDLDNVTKQYQQAAKDMNEAALPDDFLPVEFKGYSVINCGTKNKVSLQAISYLSYLGTTQKTSLFFQQQLRSLLKELPERRNVAMILQKEVERAMGIFPNHPGLRKFWWQLEKETIPAIAQLISATNRQLGKLRVEYIKADTRMQNLSSNIRLIENLQCGGLFVASLSSTPVIRIGVDGQRNYDIHLSKIELNIELSDDGKNIVGAFLKFLEVEKEVETGLSRDIVHRYSSLRLDINNNQYISLIFSPYTQNEIKCVVTFTGILNKDLINGQLKVVTLSDEKKWPFTIVKTLQLKKN